MTAAKKGKQIAVTLVKSPIGSTERQRNTLRSLGLRRIGNKRVHTENEPIKGMINTVAHLVRVEDAG